jgi:pentatricopeptide repeat protein
MKQQEQKQQTTGFIDQIFKKILNPSIISYSVTINSYIQLNELQSAIELLDKMEQEGNIKPDKIIFGALVSACVQAQAIDQAKLLHEHLMRSDVVKLKDKLYYTTALIKMFGKCKDVASAVTIFTRLSPLQQDVVCYSALMKTLVNNGNIKGAVEALDKMENSGIKADSITYGILLSGCVQAKDVDLGNSLYQRMIQSGISLNSHTSTFLSSLYGKSSDMMPIDGTISLQTASVHVDFIFDHYNL